MPSVTQPTTAHDGHQHKRTTSAVLKSVMSSRSHKRSPSAGDGLVPVKRGNATPGKSSSGVPRLPEIQTYATQLPLTEVHRNQERTRSSPRKPIEIYDEEQKRPLALHTRTKSAVSLKSLMGKEKDKTPKIKSPPDGEGKPKKSKSSTNLAALLTRSKSSKNLKQSGTEQTKEKENQTPPGSATMAPPPIWAQFATEQMQEPGARRTDFPGDSTDINAEIARYTPKNYSPSKQRNFDDVGRPTLSRRAEPKPRPKSEYIRAAPSMVSFVESLSGLRKLSGERSRPSTSKGQSGDANYSSSREERTAGHRSSNELPIPDQTTSKRGSRVMAAVSEWNNKSKDSASDDKGIILDVKEIETAFEQLLDSRNIASNMRDKLRALDTNIKADFIKKDRSGSSSSMDRLDSGPSTDPFTKRPEIVTRSKTDVGLNSAQEDQDAMEKSSSPKKSRPRSRTFTLSKGDGSPSKKQKSERPASRGREKSTDLPQSKSSKSLTSDGTAQALAFVKPSRPAVPEDFVLYLRKVQKPEEVQVDKLRKLRQLLRNETVSWVDSFIAQNGMAEIAGLLYRIIEVEWREEHEDALLHEALLCLKALCTTSLALSHLTKLASTLLPTLLGLLFSADKKGPSEFTTRSIIVSLLFTHLSTAPTSGLALRAREILGYLRDPTPPEDAKPPGFIETMHHPRPYRIWCKEMVNVTKEVFWIFLHHLNVIPYPAPSSTADDSSYMSAHFPRERPPVPAAPYVGGVEWDATNYLAIHLDLLNGIIACLSSRKERNSLRQELKDSGFERCLGASLRTCKEKFYGAVHAGLSTWIGAARADGWDCREVREGPRKEDIPVVRTSPRKKKEEAPKLEMPKLELQAAGEGDGWL